MPKTEIDYSNTIIYKITCNDSNISDLYVGHTTNFVQRKHAHKQSSINEKSPNYKCKLYDVIRNNGGWENWKMEIINFFNCKNHYEARKKEQEYFLSLNATLNSIEPYAIPKPKEIIVKDTVIKEVLHCNTCNKNFINKDLLEIHNNTNKHIKNTMFPSQNTQKIPKKFKCECCYYITCNKKDYNKHLTTIKHIHTITNNNLSPIFDKDYICECGKKYKHNASLFNHKKKCITPSIFDPSMNEFKALTDLVLELVKKNTELQKQNQDFQKQVLEICKNNIYINNLDT